MLRMWFILFLRTDTSFLIYTYVFLLSYMLFGGYLYITYIKQLFPFPTVISVSVTQSCWDPMDLPVKRRELSRQEYWHELPFTTLRDLPNPGDLPSHTCLSCFESRILLSHQGNPTGNPNNYHLLPIYCGPRVLVEPLQIPFSFLATAVWGWDYSFPFYV